MTEGRAEGFERYKIEWLRLGDIARHPKVQRPYREKRAKQMAAEFDPDLFGTIDVIRHRDKFLVFGGQHRHGAAILALGEDQKVPCHVHEDAAIEDLARICLGRDDAVAWKTLDKWPLRILAKEEVPLKIEVILHRHKLVVGKNTAEGVVRATSSIETTYDRYGGEILDRALGILIGAYGRDKNATDASLISGTGYLLYCLGASIDDDDLAKKMSRYSGPARMVGAARDYSKAVKCGVIEAMAEKLLGVYNARRATHLDLPRRSNKSPLRVG